MYTTHTEPIMVGIYYTTAINRGTNLDYKNTVSEDDMAVLIVESTGNKRSQPTAQRSKWLLRLISSTLVLTTRAS